MGSSTITMLSTCKPGRAILSLLFYLSCLVALASAQYEQCNDSWTFGSDGHLDEPKPHVELTFPGFLAKDQGKPFYCWFRFSGGDNQTVQIRVTGLKAGKWDRHSKTCSGGYLRIHDGQKPGQDRMSFEPTTLCGNHDKGKMMVKRYTSQNSAFVEFRLDRARANSMYQIEVTFYNKTDNDVKLTYGNPLQSEGKIARSKCHWLIPVESCFGYCHVVSPGYPGIYPPNTRCQYLFTNFDDERVDLRIGGRGFSGKFDLKPSKNCTEDNIRIYDGTTESSALIGRFCGQNGARAISTGPSLLMVFETGPGGPSWDYSGFDAMVANRWEVTHEDGTRQLNTACDWTFDAKGGIKGDLHTPDHLLPNVTTCWYNFIGRLHHQVDLDVIVYRLRDDCAEFVEVFDGNRRLDKICSNRLKKTRNTFKYEVKHSRARVRYHISGRQLSKADPVWIYYEFRNEKGQPFSGDTAAKRDNGAATNGPFNELLLVASLLCSYISIVRTL